jgi:hypothetical protein
VVDAGEFGGCDIVDVSAEGFEEGPVLDWRISGDVFLRFDGIVDIDADDILGPLPKFRHLLSRELVAVASDANGAILIDYKLCVLEAPPIDFEPVLLVPDGLAVFDWVG